MSKDDLTNIKELLAGVSSTDGEESVYALKRVVLILANETYALQKEVERLKKQMMQDDLK